MFRKLQKKRYKELLAIVPQEAILMVSSSANFFGVASRKGRQIRGNGVLAVTREQVVFLQWVPKKRLTIPIRSISHVSSVKAFNGKTRFRPLLKIEFTDEIGQQEAGGWLVTNLDQWLNTLKSLISPR